MHHKGNLRNRPWLSGLKTTDCPRPASDESSSESEEEDSGTARSAILLPRPASFRAAANVAMGGVHLPWLPTAVVGVPTLQPGGGGQGSGAWDPLTFPLQHPLPPQ